MTLLFASDNQSSISTTVSIFLLLPFDVYSELCIPKKLSIKIKCDSIYWKRKTYSPTPNIFNKEKLILPTPYHF